MKGVFGDTRPNESAAPYGQMVIVVPKATTGETNSRLNCILDQSGTDVPPADKDDYRPAPYLIHVVRSFRKLNAYA